MAASFDSEQHSEQVLSAARDAEMMHTAEAALANATVAALKDAVSREQQVLDIRDGFKHGFSIEASQWPLKGPSSLRGFQPSGS